MLDTMARTKTEDGVSDQLQEIRDLVVESCEDIRQLSRGLNPTGLSEGDLPAALKRLADNNDNCSFEAIGFDTDREVPSPDDLPYLEDDAAAHLYCIAQEAIANARKYAEADQISIRLRETEDALILTIEDDGRGFNPSEVKQNGSLGLRSMKYRAELLGAELLVESGMGEGTLIRCRLPRKNRETTEVS